MRFDESNIDIEGLHEMLENPKFRTALKDAEERRTVLRTLTGLRKSKGLTQADVAERMETSEEFISELDSKYTDPHLSTLQRYARAIDVRLEIRVAPY